MFAESHEDLVLEAIPKEGLLEKRYAQKMTQNFVGQVWGNSGQNPSHPKEFAFSNTYSIYCITSPS